MSRGLLVPAVMLAALAWGCGGAAATHPEKRQSPAAARPEQPLRELPQPAPYEPDPAERFPNAKRLAARAAQRLLTYDAGATAREVAGAIAPAGQSGASLARVIAPGVAPGSNSIGQVTYVQTSGVTPTSFGAMVIVRQTLQAAEGTRRAVTRVADVRLSRAGGPWSVDSVVSIGGSPLPRPAGLSRAAQRVLDSRTIELPDTARWDIYRGAIDDDLLTVLADAARTRRLTLSVLRTGHPRNVWRTDRRSAHNPGAAADIYAVDGALVVRQQQAGSAAYGLVRYFRQRKARQIGSPWDFDGRGKATFTDAVHGDHVHLQQRAVPGASAEGDAAASGR